MGNKDRTQDKNATTSTDASRDQESRDAALARTITVAVAGALMQQKAEETQSITEAVALQTKSIIDAFSKQKAEETQSLTEALQRQMEKMHVQFDELLKPLQVVHKTFLLPLRSLPVQKALE